jgi:hypothetical protein
LVERLQNEVASYIPDMSVVIVGESHTFFATTECNGMVLVCGSKRVLGQFNSEREK